MNFFYNFFKVFFVFKTTCFISVFTFYKIYTSMLTEKKMFAFKSYTMYIAYIIMYTPVDENCSKALNVGNFNRPAQLTTTRKNNIREKLLGVIFDGNQSCILRCLRFFIIHCSVCFVVFN